LTEGSKIWLDTDLKIILLDHQNNSDGPILDVGTLKIMSSTEKALKNIFFNINIKNFNVNILTLVNFSNN